MTEIFRMISPLRDRGWSRNKSCRNRMLPRANSSHLLFEVEGTMKSFFMCTVDQKALSWYKASMYVLTSRLPHFLPPSPSGPITCIVSFSLRWFLLRSVFIILGQCQCHLRLPSPPSASYWKAFMLSPSIPYYYDLD